MNNKDGRIGMWKSYGMFWKNYVNFPTTSRRSEYWWPFLINVLINVLIILLGIGLVLLNILSWLSLILYVLMFNILFSLATLIPNLTVSCRRYRDVGISGWWMILTWGLPLLAYNQYPSTKGIGLYVLIAVMIVGFITHLVICALPSKDAEHNRYKDE